MVHADNIYIAGQAVSVFAFCFYIAIVPFCLNDLLNDIRTSIMASQEQNEQLKVAYEKLANVRKQILQQPLGNGLVSILSCCWPAFREKLVYIIPISIFFLPFLFISLLQSFAIKKSKQQSSSPRHDPLKNNIVVVKDQLDDDNPNQEENHKNLVPLVINPSNNQVSADPSTPNPPSNKSNNQNNE